MLTTGSFESAPVLGVVAVVAVVGVVDGVEEPEPDAASVLSEVFSLPRPIVEEELLEEPQPAISAQAPSIASASPARERIVGCASLKLVTVGQPNELGTHV
jgi:hypothetical protein